MTDALTELRFLDQDFIYPVPEPSLPAAAISASGAEGAGAGAGTSSDGGSDAAEAQSRIAAVFNFQRKRVPWEDIAWGKSIVADTVRDMRVT